MIKHISYVILAAQILIGLTSAQDLSKLPQCAQAPSLKSIRTTTCELTDFACICNDKSYTSSLEPIVKQACSPEDYETRCRKETLQFTQNLCGSVGVTISNNATTTAASISGSPSSTSSAVSSRTSSATASGSSIQPASSAASTEVGIGRAMLAMMVVGVLLAMAA